MLSIPKSTASRDAVRKKDLETGDESRSYWNIEVKEDGVRVLSCKP